jgi:hypothetical protein
MLSFLKLIVPSKIHIIDRSSNPAYDSEQSTNDSWEKGSKRYFHTDSNINGKYFKSKRENCYYRIIIKGDSKNSRYESSGLDYFHHKDSMIDRLESIKFDNNKHVITQLIMDDDSPYFVETNNCISCLNDKHDILLMNNIKSIDDFITKTPSFIPLPNDYPINEKSSNLNQINIDFKNDIENLKSHKSKIFFPEPEVEE